MLLTFLLNSANQTARSDIYRQTHRTKNLSKLLTFVWQLGKHINVVERVWNVMAHAQKPDMVFQRNGRVHLNRQERQFSRLLAAEVCASAVVMLDTPCSEVECKTTGYPLHSRVPSSLPLPCVTVCHHISTELYYVTEVTCATQVCCVCYYPTSSTVQHPSRTGALCLMTHLVL